MEKIELVVNALQQRIGEIVSQYETQAAILRAEITQLMNEKSQNTADDKTSADKNNK